MINKAALIRLIAGLSLATVMLALLSPRIPQDPQYHQFADTATLLGIPNFWNMASNIPFIIVGILGLLLAPSAAGKLPTLQRHYTLFFWGIVFTGLGSGYYHWSPSNQTLVWDRLPMTLSFMSFFCLVIGEHISIQAAQKLLWPFILLGICSVLYWHFTELNGHGDLRFYGLVQFLPMLLIPLILLKTASCFTSTQYLWLTLIAYATAKIFEHFDHSIFQHFGIGGHPLKHAVAALGAGYVYLAFKHRQLSPESKAIYDLHSTKATS